ncbi:hypothetical protein DRF65_10950 [Chryseobacterium pennae]|uniref:Uncharacterized protein n=1 Tax=Chryseobacterium pennae TaxID=2258962 RepID=A0A3D9C900_9FLAO|nr:sulfite exporter TauE/SafE family protein [Chryseobacterium pennae]REC62224.1 hypothetical protein DRF65_10950 [Chryseobacterium pennae]
MQLDLMELLLEGKGGAQFQEYMERYLDAKYGSRFERTTENGRKGDGGKDGYIYDSKHYFAISSRSDFKRKITFDFFNCVTKNHDVRKFTYVTNRALPTAYAEVVNRLRGIYPTISVEVLTHYTIAREIFDFPKKQIEKILNRDVDISRDNSIYFAENEDESESFTFREAIKDSIHWYTLLIIICVVVGVLFYFLHFNEQVWGIAMMGLFVFLVLYLILFGKGIKKTKFPHKILYLICSGKLPVGGEIIFNEAIHRSIHRNSMWNFTFYKRSVSCVKRGCTGKVYLYDHEEETYIGKCERDPVNHTYTVDRNFYGNLNC